jgi:hypothetical protein
MEGVVVIGYRFESYITIAVKNKTLSVYPVIYKKQQDTFFIGACEGLE